MGRDFPRAGAGWKAALVVGGVLTAAYFALPRGLVQSVWYPGIGVVSVAAIAIGIRLNRPADRATWWLFAVGSLCSVGADVVASVYQSLDVVVPVPSIADVLYLAAYPFYICAVLRLGHRAGGRASRERWVDAAIVTLGATALAWHLLMDSYAHDATVSMVGRLTLLSYPVMDIGVVFIVVSALFFAEVRGAAAKLVGAAMVVMLVGDVGYDLLAQHDAYTSGDLIDVTWLLNYVLIGVAAMHPSMAGVRSAVRSSRQGQLMWMPVAAFLGFAVPLTLLLVGGVSGQNDEVPELTSLAIVMAALVAVRVVWMFAKLRSQAGQLLARSQSLQESLRERDSLAADLRHQAFHDDLTGLANRALLHDRVDHALARLERESGMAALMLFDLDGFKNVNDSLGHRAGDSLLIAAARRMAALVRPGDTVARLGGDEFVVLMDNVPDRTDAISVAERVVSALREPSYVGEHSVALSASGGVTFGTAAASTEQLLSEADAAMYEAKARGRNRYQVFEASMRSRIVERLQLTTAFAGALERSQFYLDYQPIFALRDGRLQGFEALVRWQHPDLGLLSPLRFIPLAEETGFIVALGRWVLNAACHAATAWTGSTAGCPTVAVNVSAQQLQDPGFVADVRDALARSGLPGQRLVLEITESVLVRDPDQIVEVLNRLKQMGISIAIDDFGTGYSSLSHLRRFPVDILKIDKSFVDHLNGAHTEGRAFVEAIISLARQLGVATIAEGIEHTAQHDTLTDMGCDDGQGYLMSRPLDIDSATDLARQATAGARFTATTLEQGPEERLEHAGTL